ncbi:MAG: amidinotransferase [Chitinophagales bacterium]|nr:amidinotransferase [Chitinophagales bacterium]
MAASHLFMVRPAAFGYNTQTAESNAFQTNLNAPLEVIHQKALEEFDALVRLLQHNDIRVTVHQDTSPPARPDAIFPNNWFSTHADSSLIIYPMQPANRRAERTREAIAKISQVFSVKKTIDLTHYEQQNKFVEGTGSLVFDHLHKIGFASLSARTNEQLAREVCSLLGYQFVAFSSADMLGKEVYHTNVVMNVADNLAVVCLDAITINRDEVELKLRSSNRAVVELTLTQMQQFAGNMLVVKNLTGKDFLLMSTTAFQSLMAAQISEIEKHCEILHCEIPIIETLGGGSVRCMLAEIF